MHDSSEDPDVRPRNRAAHDPVAGPNLKAEGYRFVSLDDVPQVRSAVAACWNCATCDSGASPSPIA